MKLLRIVRIATLCVSLALAPARVGAHTSGGSFLWEGQSFDGYSYWVNVCDINFSGASESRLVDALNEWSEIGGELHFEKASWSPYLCHQNWLGISNQVRVQFGPLGGNTLGISDVHFSLGRVDQVDMTIDNDGSTASHGSYSWYTGTGSPSATQIDLESVLVHEFGHALSAMGHSTENEVYIMDDTLSDTPGGSPKGIEKDERVYAHDTALYTSLYGTSH